GHSSDTLIFVLRGCATGVEKPRMRGSSIIQLHTSRLEKITTPPADTPTAPLCPAPQCYTGDFIQGKFVFRPAPGVALRGTRHRSRAMPRARELCRPRAL